MSDADQAALLDKALGRIALVQMDNRYCTTRRDWIASIPPLRASWFWWKAAHINSLWTATHQYDHLLFCSPGCTYCHKNGSLVARRPSWCKIRAVSVVLQAQEHDTVVFMDSDAYVVDPRLRLSTLLMRYAWSRDWSIKRSTALPSLFFACNDPFSLGWPVRPRPTSTLPQALERQLVRSGPPNSGIWLARQSPSTLSALQAWWNAREDEADRRWLPPPRSWAWHKQWREQGALWDLMLSNSSGFMRHARVLGAAPHRSSQQPLRCLGDMTKPIASTRKAAIQRSVRHLVHAQFKQASSRAFEIQADLEVALAASPELAKPTGSAGGSTRRSCRTHLLRLHPTDPGSKGQCASPSKRASAHAIASPPLGATTTTQRRAATTDGDAPRPSGLPLPRRTCADEFMVQIPPCKRTLRADRCATESPIRERVT